MCDWCIVFTYPETFSCIYFVSFVFCSLQRDLTLRFFLNNTGDDIELRKTWEVTRRWWEVPDTLSSFCIQHKCCLLLCRRGVGSGESMVSSHSPCAPQMVWHQDNDLGVGYVVMMFPLLAKFMSQEFQSLFVPSAVYSCRSIYRFLVFVPFL